MGLSESRGLGPGEAPSERQVEEEEEVAAPDPLLHMEARKGHCDTARQLLAQDPEALNSQDASGRTPLFWATEYRHESLVELLLALGADPAVRDHKTSWEQRWTYNLGALKLQLLWRPLRNQKEEGNLCLHWAVYVGSPSIARMLLDAGSDVDALNGQGDSPLHLAAQERRYECLVLLLAHGAKVSLKNRAGRVAVQCCKPSSPSWRALEAASARPPQPTERLLCRDISRGFEQVPIPCVNGLDEEPVPGAFLYVTQNLVSDSAVLPATGWGRSQHCECASSCSAPTCPCVERSLRSWYTPDGRLAPDAAGSAAEAGPIYECHMLCSCASSCPNRVAQRGLRTQLQLYRVPGKGWAVRTMQEVPRGAFLCQYFGELISSAEAAQREDAAYSFVVDMQAGPECCLDGRFYGSVGRFLNHSCQPNLVALPVVVGHEIPGIAFFSARAIQAGEELAFDYGERFWEAKGRRWACLCKSPGCRYRPSREGPTADAAAAAAAAGDPGLGTSTSFPLRGFSRKSARSSPLKTAPRRSARPRRRPLR